MLLRVAAIAMLLTVGAAAQEAPEGLAEKIAEQAYGCWNLLPSDRTTENFVILDVDIADGSEVTDTTIIKQPRSNTAVARAAERAVYQCAPYKFSDYVGKVRITMVPKSE